MDEEHEPAGAPRWVLAVTALAGLMVTLEALVITTALSAIRTALDTSIEELEWTVTAYVLTFAVLLMTAAALGDRFGRRRVFIAGLALFAAASAACALAPDVGWLIAARAVQGAGAALVMPLALALLSAAYPPPQRARALGVFTGVTGLAVAVGPLLGGAIVTGISWPWVFWINLPAAAVLIILARTRIGESFGSRTTIDVVGLLLVTGAALGIVWALVRGNTVGWAAVEIVAASTAGVLLAVAFVRWERRAPEPMLPMGLFASRGFAAGNAGTFFLWGSALGALFFMAQFLQTALDFGPLAAGLGLMPWGATTFIVPQIAGALIGRFGERVFIVAGAGLHAVAMAWLALVADPGLAYWEMIAPLVLSGTGVAMASPATQSAALSSLAAHYLGKASGAYSTMRQLGGVFGVAVVVAAFAGIGGYESPHTFATGFAAAMAACAVLSLAGAIAGLAARDPAGTRPGSAEPRHGVRSA
ncbi:MFS transporter [Actinosynnema sp. CS-041913]|uniref:MFS transporter n=1 Tax=Actinosynnema sp. CS-041913 TaxID=3239917 RepID=UPI003D8F882E